ncbi:MAG: MFS transporter [Marinilabiliales bacterium]|nr:MAG: MFS transporter [Marinilabiliales bacterium]
MRLKTSKWLIIFSLIFAGEMIFSLPFHIARFFRPTLLEAFNLTNTELGDIVFPYGILAMLSYFPGGIIADKISGRKLMTLSLFATALGGIYMSFIPNINGLYFLFAWWGLTTIFMFWAPMIKTTRKWGGSLAQGKAFGLLDGGRGLAAALVSTLAVYILSMSFSKDLTSISDEERITAIKSVIWLYTILTFLAGLLIWVIIPDEKSIVAKTKNNYTNLLSVLRNGNVWLQAIVVVCAYSAYKGLDYYSLYAVDFMNMNEVEASRFVSYAAYLRPLGAIAAGFLVDRYSGKKIISLSFAILIVVYFLLTIITPKQNNIIMLMANLIVSFIAVYALRGVYFALIEETNIPLINTGTAVGVISVLGYTPDVFFNSLAGRLLDSSPGLPGYQHFYIVLIVFSIIGLFATLLLRTKNNKVKSIKNDIHEII